MTTLSVDRGTAAAPFASRSPNPARALGVLLILEALLAFAPIAILGPAIGWPASLRSPAATQLAAIAAEPGAVAFGYAVYLLYSILIAPVMIGLASRVFGGLNRPVAATIAAFAALSTLARAIGILRWLTVMPMLAAAHAGADPAARSQIELLFTAITVFGGGIGELLGVSLFMASAVALLCAAALKDGAMPRWLSALGLVAALLLAAVAAPSLGLPFSVPIALGGTLLSVWMLAAGVWVLRRP